MCLERGRHRLELCSDALGGDNLQMYVHSKSKERQEYVGMALGTFSAAHILTR